VTKDEVARKLTKANQLMYELIYAFMQTGMSYRQAEEEVFRMLKRKRLSEETKRQLRIASCSGKLPFKLRGLENFRNSVKTSNSPVLGNSAERSFDPLLILCVSASSRITEGCVSLGITLQSMAKTAKGRIL
jgi:hypothetical protein